MTVAAQQSIASVLGRVRATASRGTLELGRPSSVQEIAAAERVLPRQLERAAFPTQLRAFLESVGGLLDPRFGRLAVFGLERDPIPTTLLIEARMLHGGHQRPDRPLLPIGPVGGDAVACLALDADAEPPVVVWRYGAPPAEQRLAPIAPCFADWLRDSLDDLQELQESWQALRQLARAFAQRSGYQHASPPEGDDEAGGRIPGPRDWRPYRFCVQDVLLGALVVRYDDDAEQVEAGALVTADVPHLESGGGASWAALYLISEAYRAGGRLQVAFRRGERLDQPGTVPIALRRLAAQHGVELRGDRIAPPEARQLYLALTGFSPELRERLARLEVNPERACFAVHGGIWSVPEIEVILGLAEAPDRVLAGELEPLHFPSFEGGLTAAATAILAARLDTTFARPPRVRRGPQQVDVEDDLRDLEVSFDHQAGARRYGMPPDGLAVPWVLAEDGATLDTREHADPRESLSFLLRPRGSAALRAWLPADIEVAAALPPPRYVVLTTDWWDVPNGERRRLAGKAWARGAPLVIFPEPLDSLRSEAQARLRRAALARR